MTNKSASLAITILRKKLQEKTRQLLLSDNEIENQVTDIAKDIDRLADIIQYLLTTQYELGRQIQKIQNRTPITPESFQTHVDMREV